MSEKITQAEFERKWGPRPERAAVPVALDWPSCDDEMCEGWHWAMPEIVRANVAGGLSPKAILDYLPANVREEE